MTDMDFRKAYAAEVKASAESKKRCNDLIEWTEQQRQAAISSHAGQLRNTIAFKADVDVLVKALETAAARFNMMAGVGLVNGADPKVGYRECMEALHAVVGSGKQP